GLGEDLRTHIVAQVNDDLFVVRRYETASGSHRLGESGAVNVHFVHAVLFFVRTAAVGSLRTETVRVVDEQTEIEFLFQVGDLAYLTLHTAHTEYAFGHHQDTAAQLVGFAGGHFQ